MDHEDRSDLPTDPLAGDDEADGRECLADQRERQADIREGVLDRWERELEARALDLNVDVDDVGARQRRLAREQRAEDRIARRRASNERADVAIEREVERFTSVLPSVDGQPAVSGTTLSRALDALSAVAVSAQLLPDTFGDLLTIAVDATPSAAAATISLAIDGEIETVASTAPWAQDLDAAQLRNAASAIADALHSRTVVATDDLAGDARWALASSVGGEGRRSVLSVAICTETSTLGALTVYARPGARLDAQATLIVALLGAHASLAVRRHTERIERRAELEAWERALESRDQIGQAKGILMEQRGLDQTAAFELLRSTSQRLNTKVRAIADHVTTHRQLPGTPPDTA